MNPTRASKCAWHEEGATYDAYDWAWHKDHPLDKGQGVIERFLLVLLEVRKYGYGLTQRGEAVIHI